MQKNLPSLTICIHLKEHLNWEASLPVDVGQELKQMGITHLDKPLLVLKKVSDGRIEIDSQRGTVQCHLNTQTTQWRIQQLYLCAQQGNHLCHDGQPQADAIRTMLI